MGANIQIDIILLFCQPYSFLSNLSFPCSTSFHLCTLASSAIHAWRDKLEHVVFGGCWCLGAWAAPVQPSPEFSWSSEERLILNRNHIQGRQWSLVHIGTALGFYFIGYRQRRSVHSCWWVRRLLCNHLYLRNHHSSQALSSLNL
jgi:hypothetical protein